MTPIWVTDFFNKYKAAAIAAATGSGVFPETVLSAAGLESNYGRSELSRLHNNFFGIKASSGWTGQTVTYPTREQDKKGNVFTVTAKFRKYPTATDGFKDYIKFISGPRYVKAGVQAAASPEMQMIAIKAAGYATDVKYADKLQSVLKMFGGYFSDLAKAIKANPATTAATILFFLQW